MTEETLFKMDRQAIRALIPSGYGKKIAKLAGVTEKSVSVFWKGVGKNVFIKRAIYNVLKEVEQLEKDIDERAKGITELKATRK